MKTLCMQHGSVWLTEQETESSWSQLVHRFDDWFSSSTVSSVDEPSPKSIFSRANPLASNCWHLTAAYSRHSRGIFCLFLNQAALTSMASWSTLQYLVLPRFKVGTQSLLNLSRSSAIFLTQNAFCRLFSSAVHPFIVYCCDLLPKYTFLISLCSVLQLLLLVYQQQKVSWKTL